MERQAQRTANSTTTKRAEQLRTGRITDRTIVSADTGKAGRSNARPGGRHHQFARRQILIEAFTLDSIAHLLIETGVRLQTLGVAIATKASMSTGFELEQTAERTAREMVRTISNFTAELSAKRSLPWP